MYDLCIYMWVHILILLALRSYFIFNTEYPLSSLIDILIPPVHLIDIWIWSGYAASLAEQFQLHAIDQTDLFLTILLLQKFKLD